MHQNCIATFSLYSRGHPQQFGTILMGPGFDRYAATLTGKSTAIVKNLGTTDRELTHTAGVLRVELNPRRMSSADH